MDPAPEVIPLFDPETGNGPPEDKMDQFFLSDIIDEEHKKVLIWEWFLEQLNTCTKIYYTVDDSGEDNCAGYVIAVLPWGYMYYAKYQNTGDFTDNFVGYEAFRWYVGSNEPSFESGLFTEVIKSGQNFANKAALDAFLEIYMPQFYSHGKRPEFGLLQNLAIAGIENSQQIYTWYANNLTKIWRAAEINGIIGKGHKSKKMLHFDATAIVKEIEDTSNSAWSEAMWPELPGFNTVYLDNIGIFTPTGYYVDAVMTNAIREIEPNFWLANRCVILHKDAAGTTLTAEHNDQLLQLLGLLPVIGQITDIARGVSTAWNANPGLAWPRIYAFGRNKSYVVASQNDVNNYAAHARRLVNDQIPNQGLGSYLGIQALIIDNIAEPLISKCRQLVGLLVQKGYITPYQGSEWQ